MKDAATQRISDKALEPLIKYCAAHRGTITKIREVFNKRTGKEWNRDNFERWLNPDRNKRIQPLFGTGLLLSEIGRKVIDGIKNDYVADVLSRKKVSVIKEPDLKVPQKWPLRSRRRETRRSRRRETRRGRVIKANGK